MDINIKYCIFFKKQGSQLSFLWDDKEYVR